MTAGMLAGVKAEVGGKKRAGEGFGEKSTWNRLLVPDGLEGVGEKMWPMVGDDLGLARPGGPDEGRAMSGAELDRL